MCIIDTVTTFTSLWNEKVKKQNDKTKFTTSASEAKWKNNFDVSWLFQLF
jgi:hypothetical protein